MSEIRAAVLKCIQRLPSTDEEKLLKKLGLDHTSFGQSSTTGHLQRLSLLSLGSPLSVTEYGALQTLMSIGIGSSESLKSLEMVLNPSLEGSPITSTQTLVLGIEIESFDHPTPFIMRVDEALLYSLSQALGLALGSLALSVNLPLPPL
jgi:hypothetical protein